MTKVNQPKLLYFTDYDKCCNQADWKLYFQKYMGQQKNNIKGITLKRPFHRLAIPKCETSYNTVSDSHRQIFT